MTFKVTYVLKELGLPDVSRLEIMSYGEFKRQKDFILNMKYADNTYPEEGVVLKAVEQGQEIHGNACGLRTSQVRGGIGWMSAPNAVNAALTPSRSKS